MGDDTNALEQVAEAVEESALTDEDVGELPESRRESRRSRRA